MPDDTFKSDAWDEMFRTDDVLSPRIVAFVNEVQSTKSTREDVWRLHHVLKGQRLDLTPGWTLDTLDTVSIYAEVPVPEGHDHPEVHDFITRCVQANEVFEGYQDQRDAEHDAEEKMASVRDRLLAGQSDFPDLTDALKDEEECLVRKIALTCMNDRQQKRAAEHNRHRNSRDYRKAPPRTIDLVDWICCQEGPIYVQDVPEGLDPYGHRLAWLKTREYLIRVMADGEILLVPDWNDPRWNPEYDPAKRFLGDGTDTWKYPTWTPEQSVHPKAGRTWGAVAEREVNAYVAAEHRGDRHPDPKAVAAHLNHHRRPEGCRFLSVDAVRKILDKLWKAGELAKLSEAEQWRHNHGWVNVPAHYCHSDEVPEGTVPIVPPPTLEDVLSRFRRKRERLEAAEAGLAA